MEAQLNAFIRCDLLGASCSYSTLWKPSPCLASRVLCLSSSLERYNRVSHSLGSWTLSSQSVDKTEINGGTDQFFGGSSNLRSYENAMEALSSLITSKKRGDRSRFSGRYGKLERMMMYIKILGLEKKIDELKIIHVAGTKGKGSTCAFCEAILHECGFHTGLFTSPHLIDVRERFRLDGTDISEEKFLHYFWDCWDQLKEKVTEDLPMPPLFQFLTIMAFKIFICEKVDVCIIEVGLGGTRDSTNVIKEPVVCGITSLGMDHMETLGDTLGKIASHKAGIFKPNIPAFTVSQLPEAMDVLDHRAQQLRVELEVVAPLSCEISKALRLGLAGDHQFVNAGLAVALCKCWLQRTGDWRKLCAMEQEESELPDAFLRGLSLVRLPGRAQIVNDTVPKSSSSSSCGELVFYLDGAHSPESMDVCARWFSNAVKGHIDSASPSDLFSSLPRSETKSLNGFLPPELQIVEQDHKITKQILLFNCMELRNPQILLPRLVDTCACLGIQFSKALFVPGISRYNKVTSGASMASLNAPVEDLSWQFNLQMIWEHIIRSNDFEDDRRIENDSVKFDSIEGLSRHEFLYEDGSNRDVKYNCYCQSSVVIPSLPLAIKWLRDYVKQNPSFKVQVLVTGSLHLVGDVLKLLRL